MKTELLIRASASNEGYACVWGGYNPIGVSPTFSSYANLAGTITHRMFSSAAVRSLVGTWAAGIIARVILFLSCNFVGIVLLLNDDIGNRFHHASMFEGRKILKKKVEATGIGIQVKGVVREGEFGPPVISCIFHG